MFGHVDCSNNRLADCSVLVPFDGRVVRIKQNAISSFFSNMSIHCLKVSKDPADLLKCLQDAMIFYLAVCRFGDPFWEVAQVNGCVWREVNCCGKMDCTPLNNYCRPDKPHENR